MGMGMAVALIPPQQTKSNKSWLTVTRFSVRAPATALYFCPNNYHLVPVPHAGSGSRHWSPGQGLSIREPQGGQA